MNNKLTNSLVKVLVLIAVVVAMVLAIPSSVIPTTVDDVIVNNQTTNSENVNGSNTNSGNSNSENSYNATTNKNQNNLTNSILLNDLDDNSTTNENGLLSNNNMTTSTNTQTNSSNGLLEGLGGGSSFNGDNDNLLTDNNYLNADGDMTTGTADIPLKYFDVTLFDYNTDVMNYKTKVIDRTNNDKTFYDGIYFKDTSIRNDSIAYGYYSPTYDASGNATVENGRYLILNIRGNQFLTGDSDSIDGKTNNLEATIWTITQVDGGYTIKNENGEYMNIGSNTQNCKLSTTAQTIKIDTFKYQDRVVQLGNGNNYLNQYGGESSFEYGGYNKNDDGNKMYLIKIDYVTPEFETNGKANIQDGYYYIVNNRSGEYLQGTADNVNGVKTVNEATVWKITTDGTSYKVQTTDGQYLNVGTQGGSTEGVKVSGEAQNINIKKFTPRTSNDVAEYPEIAITFDNGSKYLNDYNGTGSLLYGNENTAGDGGNSMYLIPLSENRAATLVTPTFDANNVATDISGNYYIKNKRSNQYLQGTNSAINGVTSLDEATIWTITKNGDGTYVLTDENGNYLNTGTGQGRNGCNVSSTPQNFDITKYTASGAEATTVKIGKTVDGNDGYYWLSDFQGGDSNQFGNWHETNDTGHAMYLYEAILEFSLVTVDCGTNTIPYAPWNVWTGEVYNGDRTYSGYTYNGLVEDRLNSNGDIVFKTADGGIFNENDTSTKDVYTNVGLPFRQANGFYSFDALADSARFVGAAASNKRLTFNDTPQKYTGNQSVGNKEAGFFPFNSGGIEDRISNPNYHFGLKLEMSFYITPNGVSVVDGSDIEFNFAGDDDVWVYIDDQLVLDLGGIHDSVDANINFAKNTVTVKPTKSGEQASGYFDANDGNPYDDNGNLIKTQTAAAGETPQPLKIFSEGEGTTSILSETREEFTDLNIHKMTIYYLERGAGESNFEMGFNLPLNDTVSVSKVVDGYENLSNTDPKKALINNLDYTFVLYKDGEPLTNTPFRILDSESLELISTATTDANGEFSIKRTQIASFIDDLGNDENKYYAVEKTLNGFGTPTYAIAHRGAGVTKRITGEGWRTDEFSATGLSTYMDNVSFVFTNYLDLTEDLSVKPNDDLFVLDFGVSANLGNVLANDLYTGGAISLTNIYCPAKTTTPPTGEGVNPLAGEGEFGTFTVNRIGEILYTLNKQLTKPEVLKYTVTVTAQDGTTKSEECTIYIMPATSIYYEEDFDGLVTYKVSNGTGVVWEAKEETDFVPNIQESGRVSDSTDSPYGSDESYKNDGKDSNGTSMYVNTTNGAAQFVYTFKGTGTSFFARTSNSTGTMRVRIKDANGSIIYELMRDTSYKTDDNNITLYNIPVFTYHADAYGEYTVEVTLARSTITTNNGNVVVVSQPEFYLDGITVFNPLDKSYMSTDEKALVDMTLSAYGSDGEANNTVATLREKLITDYITDDGQNWTGDKFAVFTDTNGNILLGGDENDENDQANVYVSDGPKEEVYMVDGQKIKFGLKGLDVSNHKVYIGLKAPMGGAKVLINGNELSIDNSKECYYDITKFVTLATNPNGELVPVFAIEADKSNEEGASSLGLISVTNIRVTGNVEFTIAPDVNM